MVEGGMPRGSRNEGAGSGSGRAKKPEIPKLSLREQLAAETAKLKANESARFTADQAPYEDATLEGDMETSGDLRAAPAVAFEAAPVEEGDVPSWDTADLKESVLSGMGMAPNLDTDQYRFGDPRALNMVQAADAAESARGKAKRPMDRKTMEKMVMGVPLEEGENEEAIPAKEKKVWKSKGGNVEIDMEAMVVGTADIFEMEPKEQAAALKTELDPADMVDRVPALSRLEQDMPEAELEAISNAFGEGFGPEGKKAAKEAVQEIKDMPEAKKERTLNGITNLGVFISEWKSDKMGEMLGWAEKKTDGGSFMNRLLKSSREFYERKSASNRRLIESTAKMASLSGAMTGAAKMGSILSWGRVALDIVGKGAFAKHINPFRHMTAGAMAFGTGAEIAKEVRFKAEGLREKTRVQDWEDAEGEARALYEEAKKKAGGGEVTVETLTAAYQENLPKDLLARLEGNIMAGSTFVGHVIKKDLTWGVARIQKKLDAIEANGKLNVEQKEKKRQELLVSYNGFLREADLMTTRVAGVDAASYAARLLEKSAKAFVTVMAVDTIARLFLSAHEILDRNFGQPENAFRGVPKTETAQGPNESLPTDVHRSLADAEVMTAESRNLPPGFVSLEMVGPGGSITGSLMKQLEEHPEKFGYTGETGRSSEQLHAWAFKTAKQMAKSAGFLTRKDQQDTWLSGAAVGKLHVGVDMSHGKPELAMVDSDGRVLGAAELKAGSYAMETPGGHKELPPVTEPAERPSLAQDYYLKKVLGAGAGNLDTAAQKDLGSRLFRLKVYNANMRDETLSSESRAQARAMAVGILRETSGKYRDALPRGWTEKLNQTESYTAFVQRESHGAEPVVSHEEEKPHVPMPKPLRRPVHSAEPTPEPAPAPKLPEGEPLVFNGVEHPEWGQEYKEALTPAFNALDAHGEGHSKDSILEFLHDMDRLKKAVAMLPASDPQRANLLETLEQGKTQVAPFYAAFMKPDWFEQV